MTQKHYISKSKKLMAMLGKHFGIPMLAIFLSVACNDSIHLSGQNISVEDTLNQFRGINVHDGIELVFQQDTIRTLKFDLDENILPHVKYRIRENILLLYCDRMQFFPSDAKVTIYVNADSVKFINATTGAALRFQGDIKADNFQISLTDRSSFAGGTFECKQLIGRLDGHSTMNLHGTATILQLQANRESTVNADKLAADSADIYSANGSSISVWVDKSINIDASGAGTVNLQGDANINSALLTGDSNLNQK